MAETIALFVAGFLTPFLTEMLKGRLTGWSATLVAYGVSLVLAFAAILITGGDTVWTDSAAVFALSQIVYRRILK